MSDHAGKKAELDKNGIIFEKDNAELDQEGISLRDEEYDGGSKQPDAHPSDAAKTTKGTTQSYKVLIIASITGIILIATLGILWNSRHNSSPPPVPDTSVDMAGTTSMYSPESDIVLDPFMILLNSQTPHKSGLLLAQLSLHITPETAANIQSTIFAVRSLILERLSTNAQIYSKKELAVILTQDLQRFNVKDVAFIQYEIR